MALSFFEEVENTSGNGDKLFAKDFLEVNKKEEGRQFPIKEIKLVKSNKGYLLETEYFMCWLWRKESVTQHLLEALKLYCETGKGYQLFAVLKKNSKNGFQLAIDPEIPAFWYDLGNGSFSLNPQSSSAMQSTNPFLPIAFSPLQEEGKEEEGEAAIARKPNRKS